MKAYSKSYRCEAHVSREGLIGMALILVAFMFFSQSGLCGLTTMDMSSAPRVAKFTDQQIKAKLAAHGYEISSIEDLRRSADGAKIYVKSYATNARNDVFIIASNSVKCLKMPFAADFYYFGKDDQPVAWFQNIQIGIHFVSGEFLSTSNGFFCFTKDLAAEVGDLPPKGLNISGFDIDPSGTFFVIQAFKDNKIYLGRVTAPVSMQCVMTNFSLIRSVFFENNRIYVSGWKNASPRGCACIILNVVAGGYAVDKIVDFPGMNSVVDVDPSGRYVLLNGESDLFAQLYIEDLMTGKIKRLGSASWRAFFLQKGVADYLSKT